MTIDQSLAGRHIIVTGGGRNVGAEVAAELVRAGAKVTVVDLDEVSAKQTAAALNQIAPGSGFALACNVADSAEVDATVASAAEQMGGLDGLVNSVAITDRGKTILDITDEEWARVLQVTLTSTMYTVRATANAMIAAGARGSIINIGSTSGYQPRANAIAYPTAKSATLALTRSMARQLGKHGIRVNVVTPNKVGSPVGEADRRDRPINNLIGRACEPSDIAKAVAFVLSDNAGFITGVDLVVDGGALVSMDID